MTEAVMTINTEMNGKAELTKKKKNGLNNNNNIDNNNAYEDDALLVVNRKSAGLKGDHLRNVENGLFLNLDEDMKSGSTELQRFYGGTSILVTGATGFMGKVLIEKLLRSCPDIEKIYLVVREKRGRTMEERIEDLTSSPCFDRIKKEFPKFRAKLHPIAGDISQEGLAMSEADKQHLSKKVNIVFHVAATVRFDENLRDAIFTNVRGTREVLNLCHTIQNLKCVLHVSTVYANCPSPVIDEQLYEPPLECTNAIHIAECLDRQYLDQISPTMIGEWPNTYAYTKLISENAVKTFGKDLPVGIFRPAIVVCTREEPAAGWIDNMYGPAGVMAGVTAGLMRTLQANGEKEANVIPCDMAINAMIAAARDIADRNRELQSMPVYNFVSPTVNPITWSVYATTYMNYGSTRPTSRAIWYWTLTLCSNRLLYLVLRTLFHVVPGLFMDFVLVITNNKPRVVKAYDKIHKYVDVVSYFATRDWTFHDGNVVAMWKKLERRDRELFDFDMRGLDWDTYIRESCPGIRVFLLKDPLDTVPAAKIRMKKLYVLHRLTQVVCVGLLVWFGLFAWSCIFSERTTHSYIKADPQQP